MRLSNGVAATVRATTSSTKVKGVVTPAEWARTITKLERSFSESSWLTEMVQNVQSRATRSQMMDLHLAVYIHKFEVTKARLEVKQKVGSILLVPNWDFSVVLAFPRPRLGDKSLVLSSLLSK